MAGVGLIANGKSGTTSAIVGERIGAVICALMGDTSSLVVDPIPKWKNKHRVDLLPISV